jgi:hypothetical protein
MSSSVTVHEDLPIAEDEYRRFKRLVYSDAMSDLTGVYEAWWEANGAFPELAISERLRLAEIAVAALIERRLVELYRGSWDERPGERIPREEYEAVLRKWTTWATHPDAPIIWIRADERADTESVLASQ